MSEGTGKKLDTKKRHQLRKFFNSTFGIMKKKINQNVIYSKPFIDRGIIKLFHIFNNTGSIMNFTEINLEYGIDKSMFFCFI